MTSSPAAPPSPVTSLHCLNCDTPLTAAYCPECGQRADTERITSKRLWQQIFEAFTDLDRGFLYTLKVLTIAPGRAIKDYLAGHRAPMYNPFRFYILTAAALIIVTQLTGFDIISQSTNVNSEVMGLQQSERQLAFQKEFAKLMGENMQTLQLIFLPIIAFGSWVAFGLGGKANYPEQLIYQCYASGYSTLVTTAAIPVFHYVPGGNTYYVPFSFGIFLLLSTWFTYGLFGKNVLSLALQSVVAFIIYMICTMIIMIPGMIIYIILHPELFR